LKRLNGIDSKQLTVDNKAIDKAKNGSMTDRLGKIKWQNHALSIANFMRLPAGRQVGFNLSRKIIS
jgi:hypothetical protein